MHIWITSPRWNNCIPSKNKHNIIKSPRSGMTLCLQFVSTASFSHPSLGWLYVFSSFPPRPRPPRLPPQKLLPLTSKLFELNLWYLAHRIYGSGEMYWVTFSWPWPKVTAVSLISKNLLVCMIKWEPLTGFWSNFVENCYFGKFSSKFSDVFFQGQTLFWPYLRNGWSDWCETKRKCIGWTLGTIYDLDVDLGCFKVKFRNSSISGIVGLIDVKWKGSELIWYWTDYLTLPFDHTHDLDLGVSRSKS